MRYYQCNYAATFGARVLHSWYSYAGLLVFLCWTFGFPVLDFWYQNAALFWYRFF